jgi:annexin A7/11
MAAADAATLRGAMKGMGTNEQKLIDIICVKTPAELRAISVEYRVQFTRELLTDIKDETSGNFEKTLTMLLTEPADLDATLINTAVKGLGTNEHLLIEILATRTPDQLAAAAQSYKKLFNGRDMLAEIKDDVSGDFGRMCLACFDVSRGTRKCDVAVDLAALYSAGEGKLGTNEAKFIEILVGSPRVHCEALNAAYATKYGKGLDVAIKSEMNGALGRGLAMMCTPVPLIFTEKIYNAMKGAGTNDTALIRCLVTNRGRLGPIAKQFADVYKKPLSAWIADETSGDYRTALLKVLSKEGC